jgi:hypothetical protein
MPAGIDCGTDCTETLLAGTPMVLTAVAGANSVFAGWTGSCSGTGLCSLTVNAAASVGRALQPGHVHADDQQGRQWHGHRRVEPDGHQLRHHLRDPGRGFNVGQSVILTATPAANSTFTGWSGGGCTGTGPCTTTIAAATRSPRPSR